jgi:hypothetical protein
VCSACWVGAAGTDGQRLERLGGREALAWVPGNGTKQKIARWGLCCVVFWPRRQGCVLRTKSGRDLGEKTVAKSRAATMAEFLIGCSASAALANLFSVRRWPNREKTARVLSLQPPESISRAD